MKKITKIQMKHIIIGVLVGILIFPTITLGGTFVVSLIQGKTAEEAIQILATQLDSLIGRVAIIEINQEKERACRIMNELKIAPPETKIAYYTESNNKPINASWAPDTTKELLEYLKGYMQNYNETGSIYFLHNADYMPNFVKIYIPVLEERLQEYFVQKNICEN